MTIQTGCYNYELMLRDPFGLSRGTRDSVTNLFIEIEDAYGEGAPIYYQNQNAAEMLALAEEWRAPLPNLSQPVETLVEECMGRYPDQSGFTQAVDLALHDRWGKAKGEPLYKLWDIKWENVPLSSFTISLDSHEVMLQKAQRAKAFPILKIKTGGADDLTIIQKIHESTGKPLTIDANEGWTVEQSLELLPMLAECDVRMLEQPIRRENKEGYAQIKNQNPTNIPLFIDEGLYSPEDVDYWKDVVDGINIKLAKCGGLTQARRIIERGRHFGLKIMLGCMVESSLGATAAAHLAPLADFVDLDGPELISNDPFTGIKLDQGRIIMPDLPGIGAAPVD